MDQPVEEVERPELQQALAAFRARSTERFGSPSGLRTYFAPGRVNLMGAHLDYNGGPVMPTAVNRGTFLAIRPRGDRLIRLSSTLQEGEIELDLDELPNERLGVWADYPIGVARQLFLEADDRGTRRALSGFEVHFGGNLAIGAGLSSSASICVGTAFALNALWDLECSLEELAQAALHAERNHVGVQCGIMDPYAVALSKPGHLLWLDCKDASYEHLPFDSQELAIVVADTGIRRELAQGEFNLRVRQCAEAFAILREHCEQATCLRDVPLEVLHRSGDRLSEVQARRARHVIEEVQRTFEAGRALRDGDATGFGRRMSEAHHSMRDLYEVSCPELDLLVDSATDLPGVLGARLTGAGFGGCVVILAKQSALGVLRESLGARFATEFGREPAIETYLGDPGPRELSLE